MDWIIGGVCRELRKRLESGVRQLGKDRNEKKAKHSKGGVKTTLWMNHCFEGVID